MILFKERRRLAFDHNTRSYVHKIWFTNIGLSSGKPISFMSNFHNSFFALSMFWQTFREGKFHNYSFLCLLIQWQASILFPSTGQPTFLNIFKTFFSKSPLLTLRSTPTNSKHSRLEYWAFPQRWNSTETNFSESTEFNFFSSFSKVYSVYFDIEIFVSYRRLTIKVVKIKP